MRIRNENLVSVAQRLRGEHDRDPISFVDPRVLLFVHGTHFRPLAPPLNRPPMWPVADFPQNPTLPMQHESNAVAFGQEPMNAEAT
jgi:hypothetical protein